MGDSQQEREDDDVVARVQPFVEDFASALVQAGVPRMPARVFVHLLASAQGRLTAAELSERLVASPAAISGAVRYLTQQYMVVREREPGSRRDHYVVRQDVWYEATIRRDQLLEGWIEHLDGVISVVGVESAAGRRLMLSREFFAFVLRELPLMLERWEHEKVRLLVDRS